MAASTRGCSAWIVMKVSCTSTSSAPDGDLGACRQGACTGVESGCWARRVRGAGGERAYLLRPLEQQGERLEAGRGSGRIEDLPLAIKQLGGGGRGRRVARLEREQDLADGRLVGLGPTHPARHLRHQRLLRDGAVLLVVRGHELGLDHWRGGLDVLYVSRHLVALRSSNAGLVLLPDGWLVRLPLAHLHDNPVHGAAPHRSESKRQAVRAADQQQEAGRGGAHFGLIRRRRVRRPFTGEKTDGPAEKHDTDTRARVRALFVTCTRPASGRPPAPGSAEPRAG